MRLHAGLMVDPTRNTGPDRVSSRSGCRKRRASPAAAPPDGKFPMRPKRVRRACRKTGGGAGERASGDRMEGKGSGCDRPRIRMPMRMRGTRHARYLQTLPQTYLYAAYLTQPYSYAEYVTAEYAYADIT